MRHPKRRLQEYLNGQATPARSAAVQSHLARCAACRAEAARQRRLRSRLRTLEVPAAGPELRDPIEHSARLAAGGRADGYAAAPAPGEQRDKRRRLVSVAGAVAAVVVVVLSTAYLLGGGNQGNTLSKAAPGLASGWTEITGGASSTLSGHQISDLRSRGWVCPELHSLGMSLVTARAARIDGQPAVVMTLEGKGSTVTVYETRPDPHGASSKAVIDAVSGSPAANEGFVLQQQDPGRPQIWRHPQRPEQAVLAASRVTYTVEAVPHGVVLEDAVDEISLTESSRLVLLSPETAQGVWDRIQHGFALMAGSGNSR